MPREIIPQLEGFELKGIYVISVQEFPKTWLKVGYSGTNIARRLRDYSTYFPNNFYVVALILYKDYPDTRKVEGLLHDFFKDNERICGYNDQHGTEWFDVSKSRQNAFFNKMKSLASETNGAYSHFGNSHRIVFPY